MAAPVSVPAVPAKRLKRDKFAWINDDVYASSTSAKDSRRQTKE